LKLHYEIDDKTTFKNGYFIKNPDMVQMEYNSNNKFVVTLENNNSLKEKLIETIQSAKYYIKLCSFIVSDQEIVSVLEDVLHSHKVAVFILTSVRPDQLKTAILNEDENLDGHSDQHFVGIDKLLRLGAHVRAHEAAHAKFIIKDGTNALLMSANITELSLNKNPESGVSITNRKKVTQLEHIFDIIYRYGTEYDRIIPTKEETHYVKRNTRIKDIMFPDPGTDGWRWTFGVKQHSLYRDMIDIIKNANSQLDISTWSVVGLEKIIPFTDALTKYVNERNGKVRVFCRAMYFRDDHLKNCQILKNLGCEIFGDIFNHSKGIVSDSGQGIIFTANIDGEHGLINGFEMGLNLSDTPTYLNALRSFINWQIETAPYIFSQEPLYKDIKEFFVHFYKGKGTRSPVKSGEKISFLCKKKPIKDKLIKDIKISPIFRVDPIKKPNNSKDTFIKTGNSYYMLSKRKNNDYNIVKYVGPIRENWVEFKNEYFWNFNKLSVIGD